MSRLTRFVRRLRRRVLDRRAARTWAELERPSALADDDATVDRDGVPIPPPTLRARVAGAASMRGYLDVGSLVADSVVARFCEAGVDPRAFRRLLDFGCGCARALRFLRRSLPSAAITGLDVDADAVAWCATNLATAASFRTIPHHPPTSGPDAAFDSMIAISVFTHLPPDMQRAWIAEWARLLEPGGHLLFSVSDPQDRFENLHRLEPVAEEDGSYYFRIGPQEGHPDWYQVAFHSDAAVERLASPHFDVLRITRRGIACGQTSVVCRRRSE